MSSEPTLFFILRNPVVVSGFWGWATAQTLKVLLGVFRERRFNFKWFVGSGGMPSSHAATVTAVAVAVGRQEGFNSSVFAVAIVFAMVTMFDAQGVRRHTGIQAKALNRILEDLAHSKGVREEPLKALIGHTPVEVLVGGLIGVVIALFITMSR